MVVFLFSLVLVAVHFGLTVLMTVLFIFGFSLLILSKVGIIVKVLIGFCCY